MTLDSIIIQFNVPFAERRVPLDGRVTFNRTLQFANKYGLRSIQANTAQFLPSFFTSYFLLFASAVFSAC